MRPYAWFFVVPLMAGCLGPAVPSDGSPAGLAVENRVYDMEWSIQDLGLGWRAVHVVPAGPGQITLSGSFEMAVHGDLVDRRSPSWQAPPFCTSFWLGPNGGDFYIPNEQEPILEDSEREVRIDFPNPFGASMAWNLSPTNLEVNESQVGKPLYVLVGIGNVDEWQGLGIEGRFVLESSAPLELRHEYTGALRCTDSFDAFTEGSVTQTPVETVGRDLRFAVDLIGLDHVWFFGSADQELEMQILRDGSMVWNQSLEQPPQQIHLSAYGLRPGAYSFSVPILRDSDLTDPRPWLRSLVLSGMAPELGTAIAQSAADLQARFGQ